MTMAGVSRSEPANRRRPPSPVSFLPGGSVGLAVMARSQKFTSFGGLVVGGRFQMFTRPPLELHSQTLAWKEQRENIIRAGLSHGAVGQGQLDGRDDRFRRDGRDFHGRFDGRGVSTPGSVGLGDNDGRRVGGRDFRDTLARRASASASNRARALLDLASCPMAASSASWNASSEGCTPLVKRSSARLRGRSARWRP